MVIFTRKIQVIKSLVAFKSLCVATMISAPQKFCDTLKSLHREFTWNGKKAKIKRLSLVGGIGMADSKT